MLPPSPSKTTRHRCNHRRLTQPLEFVGSRTEPPLKEANLAGSAAVGDEWLETLAAHHPESLRRLDLTDCAGVTSSERPLRALARLKRLEVLRLPKERWRETELAACLTKLEQLRSIDPDTLADLRSEREALRRQCDILNGAVATAPLQRKPTGARTGMMALGR